MTALHISAEPVGVIVSRGERVAPWLAAAGAMLGVAGWLWSGAVQALVLGAAGATLLLLAAGLLVMKSWTARTRARVLEAASAAVAQDSAPRVLVDPVEDTVCWCNRAAETAFGLGTGASPARILSDWLADPDGRVRRLHDRVLAMGSAAETVKTGGGQMSISLVPVGAGLILWRLDRDDATVWRGDGPVAMPMMRLDPAGRVVQVNGALRALLGRDIAQIDALFPDGMPPPGHPIALETPQGCVSVCPIMLAAGADMHELFLPPIDCLGDTLVQQDGFDKLPVGLVRLGPRGDIRSANQEARRLLGIPETGQTASLATLLEGPGRPINDWLTDALAGRAINGPEILCVSRASRERFVQVTLRRVTDRGAPELLAIVSDATEFKALEDKYTQSQKMHAIGQLAGGIAHDFNNLLTAISGYCDLLLLRHDSSDADYADLMQIQQNANRAASLVRQLLAFSRKQTLEPEVIDLDDALRDLAHLLNRLLGERVTLTLVYGEGLGPIRADRRQLEQVLMNLAVNARDAMPLGGEIRIETRAVTLETELQRDRARVPPGDYAQVIVRDEGVGIPPDKMNKIFDPFYTTKRPGEGTGLGLSTAYGIVKQTGGFIFVDSAVGEGTVFTLYFAIHRALPVVEAAAERVQDSPFPARARGVILLVEDEAPVRAFSVRALQMQGHTVLEAASGEAALELLADPELHVDLFVTDVVMPGLDGPGWVQEARMARPDVGVIFVSGYSEDQVSAARENTPNSDFLNKPYSLQDLARLVGSKLS